MINQKKTVPRVLIVLASSILFLAPTLSLAQTSDKNELVSKMPYVMEQILQLQGIIGDIETGEIPSERTAIIFHILANTSEVAIHQMRGAVGNQVFVHPDGREAVYNSDGDLVQDGMNQGFYNYFHYAEAPLKHFLIDIGPWILWGGTDKDPTSMDERLSAYRIDLEAGLRAALRADPPGGATKMDKWDRDGQLQALAMLMKAVELGEAHSLFSLFDSGASAEQEEEISASIDRLSVGLKKLFDKINTTVGAYE